MLKISYAGCPGLSPAISGKFTLKMCVAARNKEKLTKNSYFGGSRSFKIIDVDTPKKLVTGACYKRQTPSVITLEWSELMGICNTPVRQED